MKKDKLFNYIIYILSFLIVIVLVLVIYINFFIETHNISFNINGATTIASTLITCKKNLKGCYVIMPNATRNNGKVLGYSTDKNATKEQYGMGSRVYINDDITLYAISLSNYKVHIEENGVDFLENNDLTCNAYNMNTTCDIKMPQFNKLGYQLSGYGTKKGESIKTVSVYFPNETYHISSDLTLYPKYTTDRRGDDVKYDTKEVAKINGSIIEEENGISQTTSNMYIGFLNEIKVKAPFLFTGEKISLISGRTFSKVWGRGVIGICYGSSIEGHPLSRSIDIYYDYDDVDYEKYATVVHEMAHAWDFYYPYKLNGKIGNISDLDTSFDGTMSSYNKVFGTDRISAQPDIVALYNKYRSMSRYTRPFNDYAYSATTEFVAEIVSYYYMKYLVPTGKYKNIAFPDDVKSVLEKYFCIANNNYNKSAC